MKYLRITIRGQENLNPIRRECIAQEEYETEEAFWADAHDILDQLELEMRVKHNGDTQRESE